MAYDLDLRQFANERESKSPSSSSVVAAKLSSLRKSAGTDATRNYEWKNLEAIRSESEDLQTRKIPLVLTSLLCSLW